MRVAFGILTAGLMVVVLALSSSTVTAKTVIQLEPASGPAGSTVQVSGFGFSAGIVRIALAPSDTIAGLESSFVDELPEDRLMPLAEARAIRGAFHETVIIQNTPWLEEPRVEVIAIQEDPPTSDKRYFVTNAPFAVTRLDDLPEAGTGPTEHGSRMIGWMVVVLAAAGTLLALMGPHLRSAKTRD